MVALPAQYAWLSKETGPKMLLLAILAQFFPDPFM
jgi:hypothetical protein